ncbi:hypothetical protein C8E89_11458 [Mycolicibacterium moriokaense]|uniref:Uncharacterized protein n=1 Tax=Mycolicibacterium moriokaense TaxID=39691 RepID=A0A318HCI7_9MYCO|nr:hypothetical protein C8E89_11458 [Mycolicibacterium moriokaense]
MGAPESMTVHPTNNCKVCVVNATLPADHPKRSNMRQPNMRLYRW